MPKPIQVGRKERMSFGKINEVGKMPNLIDIQTSSYDWFIREGLREVFEDISPIKDYAGNLSLELAGALLKLGSQFCDAGLQSSLVGSTLGLLISKVSL